MSKTINGLIGFVAGAAAGIITGLLIAPRKGEETRQLIKDKAKKVSTPPSFLLIQIFLSPISLKPPHFHLRTN